MQHLLSIFLAALVPAQANTQLYVKEFQLQEAPNHVSVVFSHDGMRLAIGSPKVIKIVEADTGRTAAQVTTTTATPWTISFSVLDSRIVLVDRQSREFHVYDIYQNKKLHTVPLLIRGLAGAEISQDGEFLVATGYRNPNARIWKTSDLQSTKPLQVIGINKARNINAVGISPDGRRIGVFSNPSKKVLVYSRNNPAKPIAEIPSRYPPSKIRFSRDGSLVIFTSNYVSDISVWNASNGKSASPPFSLKPSRATDIRLLPGNQIVMTVGNQGIIRFWDRKTGREVHFPLIDHHQRLTSLSLSRDGSRLATADATGKIIVWRRK